MPCRRTFLLLFIGLGLIFGSGCGFFKKAKDQSKNKAVSKDTYYSIKGFLDDQWHLLHGQPIVLIRITTFNGHTDTSYVHLDSTLWKNIRAQFDPADISSPQFLGEYKYSTFPENRLSQIMLDYEAKNDDLFMRRMNIGVDNESGRIRSIFIETRKGSRTYVKTQKLTYIPDESITISAFEKSVVSQPENISVVYLFRY